MSKHYFYLGCDTGKFNIVAITNGPAVLANMTSAHDRIADVAAKYAAGDHTAKLGSLSNGYFGPVTRPSRINQQKIAKACEYLAGTDTKVENIAHLVGYEDPFYFCRLFKRITQRTPTMYRQSFRETTPPSSGLDPRHE
jgi:hypothetical protein